MIEGAVNAAYEAVVPIGVSGPAGRVRDIEAVIDTGYNGFLTLPPPLVGMRLLDGHSVCIAVESGGRVVIERETTG